MEWFPWWMRRVREVSDLNEQVHCGLGQLSNGTLGGNFAMFPATQVQLQLSLTKITATLACYTMMTSSSSCSAAF